MMFIDIQYYYVENQLIVRELATLSNNIVRHFVFLPPVEYTKLSEKDKRLFNWLNRNFHKFYYYAGDIPYTMLDEILDGMENERLFCKGHGKHEWLKSKGLKSYMIDEKMMSLR